MQRTGTRYGYVAMIANTLFWGAELRELARARRSGYLTCQVSQTYDEGGVDFARIALQLEHVKGELDHLIFSFEGWFDRHASLLEGGLIREVGLHPLFLVYFRPPISWIQSCWWQYGGRGRQIAWISSSLPILKR